MADTLLLFCEAVLYFGVMTALFRARQSLGIGLFMTALGVMHFLETYLAAVFYVSSPAGLVSPGSSVLFSGKLVMLLLLYLKEDAATVRQPIYGLFIGNVLTLALAMLLNRHALAPLPGGVLPDTGFVDEMGWLMVWGTALLFVDAILLILVYERLGKVLARFPFLRMTIAVCAVLTFDQAGFFAALDLLTGAPLAALIGGWAAKMVAGVTFSAMLALYLRWFEHVPVHGARPVSGIFGTLTYRERYEALVEQSGRDALTGLLHRGRFEEIGERMAAASARAGRPLSLLVIDVDHFKSINDRLGHVAGDRVLKELAGVLKGCCGGDGQVFRIGGEEFAVLWPYPQNLARLLGENIRQAISLVDAGAVPFTVSIGVASADPAQSGLDALYAAADRNLYVAKALGRDRVVGQGTDDVPALRVPNGRPAGPA